jgi:hypothetical protein
MEYEEIASTQTTVFHKNGVKIAEETHDIVAYKCIQCDYVNHNKEKINEHVIDIHTPDDYEVIQENPFGLRRKCMKCKICDYETYSLGGATAHRDFHKRYQFKCACGDARERCNGITYRIYQANIKCMCKQCGYTFEFDRIRYGGEVYDINERLEDYLNDHDEHHEIISQQRLQLFLSLVHNKGVDEYTAKEIAQRAYPINKNGSEKMINKHHDT